MEKTAYAILLIVAVVWLIAVVVGLVVAAFPWGMAGLATLLAFTLLFVKVARDRMATIEDDQVANHADS